MSILTTNLPHEKAYTRKLNSLLKDNEQYAANLIAYNNIENSISNAKELITSAATDMHDFAYAMSEAAIKGYYYPEYRIEDEYRLLQGREYGISDIDNSTALLYLLYITDCDANGVMPLCFAHYHFDEHLAKCDDWYKNIAHSFYMDMDSIAEFINNNSKLLKIDLKLLVDYEITATYLKYFLKDKERLSYFITTAVCLKRRLVELTKKFYAIDSDLLSSIRLYSLVNYQ